MKARARKDKFRIPCKYNTRNGEHCPNFDNCPFNHKKQEFDDDWKYIGKANAKAKGEPKGKDRNRGAGREVEADGWETPLGLSTRGSAGRSLQES